MKSCQACAAPNAHRTEGWYRIGNVWLCDRCDHESMSFTSEYEVWVYWSEDEESYSIERTKRDERARRLSIRSNLSSPSS